MSDRRAGMAQFAGTFVNPSPIRRDLVDQADDVDPPSNGQPDVPLPGPAPDDEPPLMSTTRAAKGAAPRSTTTRARRATPPPAQARTGMDKVTRRNLDIEARRWASGRRRLDELERELLAAVDAALLQAPPAHVVVVIAAGAGLDVADLPDAVADRLDAET